MFMRRPVIFFALSFTALLLSCTESGEALRAGSGSETVYGHLVDTLGNPTIDASIALLTSHQHIDTTKYDTVAHTQTDEGGRYEFSSVEQGNYALLAHSHDRSLVMFREGVDYEETDAPYYLGTDTLRATGKIVGRITYRGAGIGGAICYIRGLPGLDITDTSGVFELDSLVPGNRMLRCSPPSPFSMITFPIEIIPDSAVELGDLVLSPNPGEEPPNVMDLSASFDTTTGIVSLKWSAVSVSDLRGYLVFRNTPEGVFEPLPMVVDSSWFKDSLSESVLVERDRIRYYVVAVDTTEMRSRGPSPIATIFPAPRHSVATTCSVSVSGSSVIAAGDTVELYASYRNPTRENVSIQWFINSVDTPAAEHSITGRAGVDTLSYVWADSGAHRVWVRCTDQAGDHWWDSVFVTVDAAALRSGRWTRLPDAPFKGPTTVCGVSDGKVYVISRANNELDRWYSIYEYLVSMDKWRKIAPLGINVQSAGAALHNDCFYIVGGESSDSGIVRTVQFRCLSDTTWQYGADLPGVRRDAVLVSADDRLLLLGGRTGKAYNQVFELSDTWDLVHAMNADRACFAALAIKGYADTYFLVFGGIGRTGIHGSVELNSLSGIEGEWETVAHMPIPRIGHAAAVYGDSLVIIAGGKTVFGVTGAVELFDPYSRSWTKLDSLPTPRSELGLATVGKQTLAIGGIDADGSAVGTVEVFVP